MTVVERLADQQIRAVYRDWLLPASITLTAIAGLLYLFWPTFIGMASIWWHSPTYSYGLIVAPIVFLLAAERWRELATRTPRPAWLALPVVLIAGLVWLLGHLLALPWLEQTGAIGILITSVWALLGTSVFRVLGLPLSLLFLAIPPTPLHDILMRPLMDWTGDIAVTLLGWSDIGYTRTGDLITLSSGNWSIEKVCSGVRFFFTSAVLGIVFAARAYRRWHRRLLFIAFALVLPIVANGARVYVTILVGHLDGVAEAISVDHTVYGGLFGGLVLTLMFLIGAIWWERDDEPSESEHAPLAAPTAIGTIPLSIRTASAGVVCLAIAAIWPLLANAITTPSSQRSMLHLQAPHSADGWQHNRQRQWGWWPRVGRVDGEFYTFYQKLGKTVALYVGQSLAREATAELVDPKNVTVVMQHNDWRAYRRQHSRSVDLGDGGFKVIQNRIIGVPSFGQGGGHKLVVWHWYRIGGRYTDNPYLARLLGLWSSLAEDRSDAAIIVVATPYEEGPAQGDALLAEFLETMLPKIEAALENARRGSETRTTVLQP